MKPILVIADNFNNFASETGTMRYSELLELLRNPPLDALVGNYFIAGQGLTDMEIDHAYCLGMSLRLYSEMQHWRPALRSKAASTRLSHKHRRENVLISSPRRLGESEFEADLLIDDQNELMLDHNTGLHVQGMVLTEACRQMFLALTEKFFMADYKSAKRYFVIKEMNVRFNSFVFPLPAQIRYRVIDLRQSPERITASVDMDIIQNGQPVSGMATKFSVFDAEVLGRKEASLARESLERYLVGALAEFDKSGRATAPLLDLVFPAPVRELDLTADLAG